MQKDTPYINKVLKKKQHQRSMQYHLENIKNAKPLTRLSQGFDININNRKKQYQNQQRFTQIEKDNRILLQKISSIMNKTKRSSTQQYYNKSLNSTFRKRQNQDIQIQNAKLLKRLQEKKPNYDTQRLNKDWAKQKNVMKIMSNFPFMLSDRPKAKRHSVLNIDKQKRNLLIQPIELVRMRVVNGISFLITIQLSSKMLRITGDCKDRKQIKVIQIQRNEAIQFIEDECHGKLQQIFSHLRYDKEQGVLYLVGNQVELDELIATQRKVYEVQKNNNIDKYLQNTQKQALKRIKEQVKLENPQQKQLNKDKQRQDIEQQYKNDKKQYKENNIQTQQQNKIKEVNEQDANKIQHNQNKIQENTQNKHKNQNAI